MAAASLRALRWGASTIGVAGYPAWVGKVLSIAGFPGILLAGILGQKIAATLWTRVLGSAPPDTAQQDVHWVQLIPAAIVEGTIYKVSRMLFDRCLRLAVAKTTGNWPGHTGQGQ